MNIAKMSGKELLLSTALTLSRHFPSYQNKGLPVPNILSSCNFFLTRPDLGLGEKSDHLWQRQKRRQMFEPWWLSWNRNRWPNHFGYDRPVFACAQVSPTVTAEWQLSVCSSASIPYLRFSPPSEHS